MMDSDSDQNVRQGLIHLYCGDGKGKTTAAIGLIVRAAGHGGERCWFSFSKADSQVRSGR